MQSFDDSIAILFLIVFFGFVLFSKLFGSKSERIRPVRPRRVNEKHTNIYRKATVYDLKQYGDLSYQPLNLMSEAEISFFIKLQKAFPGYFIFPQIGASGLIGINSQPFNKDHFFSAINWIDSARVDFTLCDSSGLVVALIELDDASHDDKQGRDEARNYIYRKAGYQLFRFDCRRMPAWPRYGKPSCKTKTPPLSATAEPAPVALAA
jgi:hypothetical protein